MEWILRRQTKARKVGGSLVVTIPWELRNALHLQAADPLVTYQIQGVLVTVPLAYLGIVGEPKLVQLLREAQLPEMP